MVEMVPAVMTTTADTEIGDDKLIARIAAGDRRAFDVFARRHGDFLYASAVRMMRDNFEAQDAVQETLLRVWQKAGTWRPDGGASVRTWVYRIAHNICIDALRRRRPQSMLPETLESAERTDDRVQDSERGAIVDRALKQLPERQRAVLVLCHYQGLSNAEAAEVVGTSVKGVESLLIRARRQMRDILKPYQEGL
jgi:RNA polymerase sigma-70 factor (ECF subfamily)